MKHFIITVVAVLAMTLPGFAQDDLIHVDAGDMRFTLEGYGQVNYNVKDDGGEKSNQFELSRVILMMNAQVTKKLNFYVMTDVASKQSDKVLNEYWGQMKFSDQLAVKVGQYKTPFSLENPISPTVMGNIFFHDGVCYMAGIKGDAAYGNFSGRDFGVTLSGKALKARDGHYLMGYSAGIFNGSGMNQSENNSQKDLVLRLDYMPLSVVTLSASAYLGTGHALVDDQYGQFLKDSDYKRQRMAVGLEAKLKRLYLRSEYLRGWTEGTPSQCAYAEAWVHLNRKLGLDLVLDYEYFDRNIHVADDTRNYMCGLQWWFHKRCRISSLYQLKDQSAGLGSTFHQWVTQLQLRF